MTARRILAGAALSALFIGCLFPSFDGLKSDRATSNQGADDDDDDDDTTGTRKDSGKSSSGATGDDDDIASSSSGDPGTSSSSGTVADTGTDTAAPEKHTINCDGKTCDLATQVCCDDANGSGECKPKSAGCGIWSFACDDFTDCPAGQLCCKGGGFDIKCATSCSDLTICNTGRPCKTGSCQDELIGPPSVTVKICK